MHSIMSLKIYDVVDFSLHKIRRDLLQSCGADKTTAWPAPGGAYMHMLVRPEKKLSCLR